MADELSVPIELLVVTGISGAGRRTVGHVLEDIGWFVVDNPPPSMLPELIDISRQREFSRLAVVLDVRSRSDFQQIPNVLAQLRDTGVIPQVLFLDASDEVIVRRQESARRPMPLQGSGTLLDGIAKERELLAGLRASADLIIDTSSINIHELADRVATAYADPDEPQLKLTLMSFGFKNGIPIDADVVLDARFLPNPFWVPDLRSLTGLTQPVSDYVLAQPDAEPFLQHAQALVELIQPGYAREGKRHATIAIGCTGGKHRSTALSTELARRLSANGLRVEVAHRDLGLE